MRGYIRNLPALRNGADFPTCLPTAWRIQPIFKLSEGSTSVLSESWRPFTSFVWEKASCLEALRQITIDHEVEPPLPAFPVLWCK